MGFLYAPTALQAGAGLWVYPPSYRALVRARSGVFAEMHHVTPADFAQGDVPERALGTYALAEGVTPEQYLALKERLYDDYDALMPWFFGSDPTVPPATRRAADDFRNVFGVIAERVLMPYYRVFGRRFFTWLDGITG